MYNKKRRNSYLVHYNPNHDRLGRFSSGPGGAPNDSTSLPKGYKLNTISDYGTAKTSAGRAEQNRKSGRPMYTFNPKDKWDSAVYRGPFAKYRIMYRGAKFLDEHSYVTVKDMRMPTRQQRIDEFKNLYADKKYNKSVVKELSATQKALINNKIGNPTEQKMWGSVDCKKLKTDKDYDVAYAIFNHSMEAYYSGKSTSEYMRRMSQKYDAMVDDNNQGVYNGAHDPIIVFKAEEFLKTKGSRSMSADEIIGNYKQVEKELRKRGERPKL